MSSKDTSWLDRQALYIGAGVGMITLALLLQPALLLRLSPDHNLRPDTLLILTFQRLFLVLLAPIVAFWPELGAPRRRALLIALLLLITLGVRAVRLNTTYLDQHAHRQVDNATVARNFYEQNPSILWPAVNWRADGPNYVATTFPLVEWLAALGYRVVGEQPWVGRSLVALFTALGVIATFGLVGLYEGQAAGFFAALFMALSPLGIFFGRALVDDTPAVMLGIAGLWGIAVWARRSAETSPPDSAARWPLIFGLLALTLGMLCKIVVLYLYLPVLVILWERWGRRLLRQPLTWVILGLPLLPNLAWYAWAYYLSQHYLAHAIFGGPATNEPLTYGAYSKWATLEFVFRWAFVKRIGTRVLREILTVAGVLPGLLGLARTWLHKRPGRLVFTAWLLAVVVFTAASGAGQWYHNYYQLPFIGALAPFVGLGLAAFWERKRLWRWAALGFILLLTIFSAMKLPYYYNDWQGWILPEAEFVQSITAPGERVITVTMEHDTTLLYHLRRPGWVVDLTNPEELAQVPQHLAYGASLLILQDLEFPQAKTLPDQPWVQGLELLISTEHYRIYRVP